MAYRTAETFTRVGPRALTKVAQLAIAKASSDFHHLCVRERFLPQEMAQPAKENVYLFYANQIGKSFEGKIEPRHTT